MGEAPREYHVQELPEPIEIDGNWDKPSYEKIEPLVVNRHMGEEPDHLPTVLAKLAWDDDSLCIIF